MSFQKGGESNKHINNDHHHTSHSHHASSHQFRPSTVGVGGRGLPPNSPAGSQWGKSHLVKLAEKTQEIIETDSRIGYPSDQPDVEPESFGWLFPAQQIILGYTLREETRVVVQLGAYLGKTTLFIAEQAPKALTFVIDPWDNDVLKAEPSLNKNFANIDLFDRVPFYPTFLRNTWHLAAKQKEDGGLVGVVPMRMTFEEGLDLLKDLQVRPDVLYWEGFAHEEGLFKTMHHVQKAFPGTVIVGDGYNYPEIQKALQRAETEIFRRGPYVELGKCWTFAKLTSGMLTDLRTQYQAPENRAERTVLAGAASKASFRDLLSGLKSKTDEKRKEEADERARRRREEEEARDREEEARDRALREEEKRRSREEEERRRSLESPREGGGGGRGRGGEGRGGKGAGRGGRMGRGGGRGGGRTAEGVHRRLRSRCRESDGGRRLSGDGGDGRRSRSISRERRKRSRSRSRGRDRDGEAYKRRRSRSPSASLDREGDDGNRRWSRTREEEGSDDDEREAGYIDREEGEGTEGPKSIAGNGNDNKDAGGGEGGEEEERGWM